MGAQTDLLINALQQGNELNTKVEELQAALVAAKEEIERLKGKVAELDSLAYNNGEVYNKQYLLREAAESALASERKETERLRGVVASQHEEIHKYRGALFGKGCHDLFCKEFDKDCRKCGMNRKAAEYRAALQSRQGEE